MIKFFRRIRQSLIMQNKLTSAKTSVGGKTSKYFKYAVGEIILVVIGILIALQINNWNEARKAKNNEIALVNQLLVDAKKDSIFFEDRLFKLNNQIQFYDDILNMCNNRPIISKFDGPIDIPYQPFIRLAKQSSLIKNNPEAYNSLINKDLKLVLQNHIAEYEFAKSALEFFNTQIEEYITPIRVKYYPSIPNLYDVKSVEEFSFMCGNNETLGVIQLMKQNAKGCLRNVNRFMNSNQELSNALRQYLNT